MGGMNTSSTSKKLPGKLMKIFWLRKNYYGFGNLGLSGLSLGIGIRTKYFHGMAIIRRRRNRITTLQNDQGVWVNDPSQLEILATNYFKNLFSLMLTLVYFMFWMLSLWQIWLERFLMKKLVTLLELLVLIILLG